MQDAGGSARRSAWREGGSTLDLFGRGFTLLRFGAKAPRVEFPGIPLAVVDIDDADIAALYERRLVLVRPDGHVAWRADDPPADARAVADTVRGINIGRAARDPARAGRTSYRPRPN